MSIADHFEQVSDAALVRTYDSGSARRQFSMSLMLVLAIALASSALGVLVRFDQPAGSGTVAAAPPSYVGALTR